MEGPDKLYKKVMSSHYETRLRAIFVLGVVTLAISFWSYAVHFGHFIKKTGTEAEWGAFGDFIGGTTNPILSFLALIGIIWSISQTQRQNKVDNLFKIVELIHNEATELLKTSTIVREGELGTKFEEEITLNDLAYKFDYDKKYDTDWKAVLIRVHPTISNIITLLIQLRVYLIKLEQQCGDKSESEFFKVKYYLLIDLFTKTGQSLPDLLKDFYSERELSYLSKEATDLIAKQKRDI